MPACQYVDESEVSAFTQVRHCNYIQKNISELVFDDCDGNTVNICFLLHTNICGSLSQWMSIFRRQLWYEFCSALRCLYCKCSRPLHHTAATQFGKSLLVLLMWSCISVSVFALRRDKLPRKAKWYMVHVGMWHSPEQLLSTYCLWPLQVSFMSLEMHHGRTADRVLNDGRWHYDLYTAAL